MWKHSAKPCSTKKSVSTGGVDRNKIMAYQDINGDKVDKNTVIRAVKDIFKEKSDILVEGVQNGAVVPAAELGADLLQRQVGHAANLEHGDQIGGTSMKFSCEKALLSSAVSITSRAVAAKSSIPAAAPADRW